MNCYVTLILLLSGCSLNSCSQFPLRVYYFVNKNTTWTTAQQYCRNIAIDLATIDTTSAVSIVGPISPSTWAWIGLNDDPKSWNGTMGNDSNSWRWSTTGNTSKNGFEVWGTGEPNFENGYQSCVLMDAYGEWMDASCDLQHSFVCYNVTNQNQKVYVFIPALMTWNSAQTFCRQNYTDLAMIENSIENTEVVFAKQDNNQSWIGLYRVPWTWSDKSQSSMRKWQSGQPDSGGNKYCAAVNRQHEWASYDCNANYPFICYQVSKLRTMVKMNINTNADLTNPAINVQILQQLGLVLTNQGWTNYTLQWKVQPKVPE